MLLVHVLAVSILASPAIAEEPRTLLRLQGGMDFIETPEIEGVGGRGVTIGAGLERRLSSHYGVTAQGQYRQQGTDSRVFDISGSGPRSLSASAALRVVSFRARRVTPYVTAGIGLIHAVWRNSVFRTNDDPRDRETALTVPLAVGANVRLEGVPHIPSLYIEVVREFTNTNVVFPHGLATRGIRIGVHASR